MWVSVTSVRTCTENSFFFLKTRWRVNIREQDDGRGFLGGEGMHELVMYEKERESQKPTTTHMYNTSKVASHTRDTNPQQQKAHYPAIPRMPQNTKPQSDHTS